MKHRAFPRLALAAIGLALLVSTADAQERKALIDVDTDTLTDQTQFSAPCGDDHMNVIWVIPVEFWQAAFEQDRSLTAAQRREILELLDGFVVFGIVQADISVEGAFTFYPESEVLEGLSVSHVDADGASRVLEVMDKIPPETEQLLGGLKPILTAAMGELGANFHFMVIEDGDGDGDGDGGSGSGRAWDPYAFGTLKVNLQARSGDALKATLDGPIDALFVPRQCPNGKDAHVTWKFCPWTGEALD